MSALWLDGSAGASGDMLLGALVDAGVPLEVVQRAIEPLELGIRLHAEQVRRHSLAATKVGVEVPDPRVLRRLPEVLELLEQLPRSVSDAAADVFGRLARAEAAVHRMPVDEVHFHEIGALDCLADVVGVVAGIEYLAPERILCSPLSLGSGRAHTAHGVLPVPVPAVLELLTDAAPVQAGPAPFESTTPTGAALLVSLVDEWGPMPPMMIRSVGNGAGTADPQELANVVRLVVGDPVQGEVATTELQIEANVDDIDPRLWPSAIAAILDAGAVDAWVTPITMKKGRPAFTLGALCPRASAAAVRAAVFHHTTSIGLREFPVTKHALARTDSTVEVDGHPIRVKTATRSGARVNRSVEWDDVVAAADALGRTPKDVLADASRRAGESDDGR